MEARIISAALVVASLLSLGASSRSQNFIVQAPTPQLAARMTELAEQYRRELAIDWLGHELPPWRDKCPIYVQVGPHLGAGGATSFCFDRGRPFNWRMDIQGPQDRLLDSVLPHEITHMIFATHFGQPLPRWLDEGAATSVEHESEKHKQQKLLVRFLTTDRGIAFNEMFAMMDYPQDMLPLYSQGYSLARFLIDQGGRRKFVRYVGDGLRQRNWTAATRQHYGYGSLSELQVTWLEWVRNGCPPVQAKGTMIADASGGAAAPPEPAPNAMAASPAPFDSWYAKQGRRPQAEAAAAAQPAGRGGFVEPLLQRSTSRAQDVGQPQPMVIPDAPAVSDPRSAGGPPAALIGTPPPRVPLPAYR